MVKARKESQKEKIKGAKMIALVCLPYPTSEPWVELIYDHEKWENEKGRVIIYNRAKPQSENQDGFGLLNCPESLAIGANILLHFAGTRCI